MNTTEKEEFMDEYNDLMVPQGFTSLPSTESTFDIYLDMIKNVNMYLLNYQTSKDTTVLTDLDIYYSGLPDKYNFTSGLDSLEGSIQFLDNITETYNNLSSSPSGTAGTTSSAPTTSSSAPSDQDIIDFCSNIVIDKYDQYELDIFLNNMGKAPTWIRPIKIDIGAAKFLANTFLDLINYLSDVKLFESDIIGLNTDSIFSDSPNPNDIISGSILFVSEIKSTVSGIIMGRNPIIGLGLGLRNYLSKSKTTKPKAKPNAKPQAKPKPNAKPSNPSNPSTQLSDYFQMSNKNNIKVIKPVKYINF
jgi:hypothetical protein